MMMYGKCVNVFIKCHLSTGSFAKNALWSSRCMLKCHRLKNVTYHYAHDICSVFVFTACLIILIPSSQQKASALSY